MGGLLNSLTRLLPAVTISKSSLHIRYGGVFGTRNLAPEGLLSNPNLGLSVPIYVKPPFRHISVPARL